MMMNSSIAEQENEGRDFDDYDYEESERYSGAGCGCFRLFWRRDGGGDRRRLVKQQEELNGVEQRDTWLNEKLNQLKERSEIVAGPKWKNFIRKFGKYWKSEKGKTTPFQYDPEGYALNFDRGEEDEEEERLMVGFTSRFAPPFSGELNKERANL